MNTIYVFEQKIKDLDNQIKQLDKKKKEITILKYQYQEYINKEKLRKNREYQYNWINGNYK
tara:strand:- start:704 stop:886 length:183 start_codon:yes stop_codon:yes gene_type:complete